MSLRTVIFREVRDPATGKTRFLRFTVEARDQAHLAAILARIDALYPREGRTDG